MAWLTELKYGAAASLLVLLCGVFFHWGGSSARAALDADRAAQAVTLAKALTARDAAEVRQDVLDNAAETTHAQTLTRLELTAPVSAPVFVYRPGALCVGTVPGATGEAHAVAADPGGGGAQPGPGVDIRPRIEALKAKYERVLADYRRLDAEWPTQ